MIYAYLQDTFMEYKDERKLAWAYVTWKMSV